MLAVILLDHIARQPAVWRESKAALLGPQTDLPAPLAAGCRPAGDTRALANWSGVLGERPEPVTEFGRVSRVQVDFVGPAVQAELDGLLGWPPSQVIFQLHVNSVHYFPRDDGLLF